MPLFLGLWSSLFAGFKVVHQPKLCNLLFLAGVLLDHAYIPIRSVELREAAGGNILVIKLNGKLTKPDYERFVPEVERLIKQHGKLLLLVQMHDFHGWSAGALWEDIKFDWKHFSDIERLALVGDRKWEAGMAMFCKPFTTATVRFFDTDKSDEAVHWINEELLRAV